VGIRTDVLDGCPKAEGMNMLLRGMCPRVIAVDELGGRRDMEAVENILNAGICLICTVHGRDVEDVRQKPGFAALMNVLRVFVVLRGVCVVAGVYDREGKPL
jgi:stage III sporulation protein AA